MKTEKVNTKINYTLIVIFFLVTTFQLKAQIVTINPGDDFNTIINNASAGDIIEFNPGIYSEYLYIDNKNFSENNPLVIRSANGPGTVTILKTNYSGNPLRFTNSSYIAIDGITLEGGMGGIYTISSDHLIIINCEIINTGQEGIHVGATSKYIDIINTEIHNTGLNNSSYGEGIYVGSGSYSTNVFPDNSEYVWIENNEIHHCGNGEAVNIKAESFHVTVRGNTIHDIAPGTPQQYNQAAITIEGAPYSITENYRLTDYRDNWIEDNHIYNVTGGNPPANAGSWDNGIMSGGMGCYIINNYIHDCNHYGIKENSYAHLDLPLWVYNNTYLNNTNDYGANNNVNTITTDPGNNPNSPQPWYPIAYTAINKLLEHEFSVFPNPVTNKSLKIQSLLNGNKKIELYDITGKILMKKKLDTEVVELQNLTPGVYFLQLTIENKTSVTKLFVE